MIKITPADSWFSKCIRARAKWRCERCEKQYDQSSTGLHCSHYFGRGNWSTRFDPDNCEALCFGCHAEMGANPHDHRLRILRKLGGGAYDLLNERRNDTDLGKMYRKTKGKGDISKFFKAQFDEFEAGIRTTIDAYY